MRCTTSTSCSFWTWKIQDKSCIHLELFESIGESENVVSGSKFCDKNGKFPVLTAYCRIMYIDFTISCNGICTNIIISHPIAQKKDENIY